MTMELDEMKSTWQALDRRLGQQHALNLQLFRESMLDKTRRGLRPLILGQMMQIAVGVWVMILFASFWVAHRDSGHLMFCGLLAHAYGLLLVVFAARNLHLINRIDYDAPVVEIQRRLGELRAWRMSIEAPVFAVSGCFIWIPAVLVLFRMAGADVWMNAPSVVWIFIASGFVCLAAVYGVVHWSRRPGRERIRKALDNGNVGSSIRRAQAAAENIARFEQE
jgi:hypothetical protein